jgi:hypothetical protein
MGGKDAVSHVQFMAGGAPYNSQVRLDGEFALDRFQ